MVCAMFGYICFNTIENSKGYTALRSATRHIVPVFQVASIPTSFDLCFKDKRFDFTRLLAEEFS